MPDASPIFFQRDPTTGAVVFEFTGRKFQAGDTPFNFPGGVSSVLINVPHSLGVKPLGVVVNPIRSLGVNLTDIDVKYQEDTSDANTLKFLCKTVNGSSPLATDSFEFNWIAGGGDQTIAIAGASSGANMDGGSVNLTFQAAQSFSDTLTVNHNLTVVPRAFSFVPLWTGFNPRDYLRLQVRNPTSTQFLLTATTGDDQPYPGPGSILRTIYWAAFA